MKYSLLFFAIVSLTSCKETTIPTLTIAYSIDSLTNKTIEINNNIINVWEYSSTQDHSSPKFTSYQAIEIIDTIKLILANISCLKNDIAYCKKNMAGQIDLVFIKGNSGLKNPISFPDESTSENISKIVQLIERQYKTIYPSEHLRQDLDGGSPPSPLPKITLTK